MNAFQWAAVAAAVLSAGCATSTKFADATQSTAKIAKDGAAVASASAADARRLVALGAVSGWSITPEAIACTSLYAGDSAEQAFNVFSDGVDLVAKVAKKPDDASIGGYIAAVKSDRKASKKAADGTSWVRASADERAETVARCKRLWAIDSTGHLRARGAPGKGAIALVTSLESVITSLLGMAEQAAREQAVRATASQMIGKFDEAYGVLSGKPNAGGDVYVAFDVAALPDTKEQPGETLDAKQARMKELGLRTDVVTVGEATVLGAAVTLERWTQFQRVVAISNKLKARQAAVATALAAECDKPTGKAATAGECQNQTEAVARRMLGDLADASTRSDLDALIDASGRYQALAQLEPDKTLASLRKSIDEARESLKTTGSDVLLAVFKIASSFSDVSDAWSKFKKAE